MELHAMGRRGFLRTILAAGVAPYALVQGGPAFAQRSGPVRADVGWLDGAAPPEGSDGQTWGVAWPQGRVRGTPRFALTGTDGSAVPVQSWATAFWPDGSVKWTAHATPGGAALQAGYQLSPGRAAAPPAPVTVREAADVIEVTSGPLRWEIGRSGTTLIRSARRGERVLIEDAKLTGEARVGSPDGERVVFGCAIDRAVIEQRGPVRAVVRIEGHHLAQGRAVLPFTVRLYAYAGSEALRVVHSFVYDV